MEIFLNMSVPFILAYATSQTQACLHLATARGSNTPPLWGELAKEKPGHAPLLCSGVFDYMVLAGSPAGLDPYCYRSVPMEMLRDVLKSTVFRGIQRPPVKHNIVICL